MIVRAARTAADWMAVRELCCLTGDAGAPIAPARWPFFAECWIGPYQRLRPAWTLVAEQEGRLCGYLTGCPDTRAFRRARWVRATLPLLLALALGRYRWSRETGRFARRALGLERGPERCLRAVLPEPPEARFPAHLHMNVEAAARRRGVGAALLEAFLGHRAARGVGGVHVVCGGDARRYYQARGFADLGAVEFRPGVAVYALGRAVTPRG
jgi:GNAT superfamily N-acetyltransferase